VFPPPSGRARCSECGQDFDWTDAYRARNNYFDDLPRADLWSGFGRSLLVALFPWTSWKVESAARFRLRRTWLVTIVACVVWHALAAAWVMLMQSGWLSPWGTGFSASFRTVAANPWPIEWGYVIVRGGGGSITMHTMGRGMIEPLRVVAENWLVGVVVLGLVIAARPKPNCGLLWARAVIRSVPAVGLVTFVMCFEWMIALTIESWRTTGNPAVQDDRIVSRIVYGLLLLAAPVVVLFLTWTRHVRDTGLFGRTWPIVTAMIVTPVLVAIGLAALTA
jgi:hypothetical protein